MFQSYQFTNPFFLNIVNTNTNHKNKTLEASVQKGWWIHTYMIKDNFIWNLIVPVDSFWTISKIFNLWSLGQSWIKYIIRDGHSTFLWLGNWHPLGPLYKSYGDRVVYNLGSPSIQKLLHLFIKGLGDGLELETQSPSVVRGERRTEAQKSMEPQARGEAHIIDIKK